MFWSTADIERARNFYEGNGWFVWPQALAPALVLELRKRIDALCQESRPEIAYETDGHTVRAIHGCHRFDEMCSDLVSHPLLVDLAESILGERIYVYQFKVNIKQPYEGQKWPWHQDFAFWRAEDGMPEPRAVNIAISLDPVHEENGPLTVLEGSHKDGLQGQADAGSSGGDWRQHVSADLPYSIDDKDAADLATRFPARVLTGAAGTVTAFHPSIVHSSSNNQSADRRAILFITYNAVTNEAVHPSRPEFLVDRDTTPVDRRNQSTFSMAPTVS